MKIPKTVSAWSLILAGTAIGTLGQHTRIRKNGLPVFDHRLRVFEQVSVVLRQSPQC